MKGEHLVTYNGGMVEPGITILRARESDFDLAREAMIEVHERAPFDAGALRAFLASSAAYLLLAVRADRVVGSLNGYSLLSPNRPAPQFLLYEIDVREEHWNQGIGRALVQRFVEEARAAGAYEVWVITNESNTAAVKMYQNAGLQRENPDDVMMAIVFDRWPEEQA